MNVAVTGASGHVGVNLVRYLLDEVCKVKALAYPNGDVLRGLDVELVVGDILDHGVLDRAFDDVDLVYHLAGVITLRKSKDARAQRINVDGTRKVVDACLSSGVRRLVHFSSIHALSAYPADAPVDEMRPLCTAQEKAPAYDHTKADAERAVLSGVARGLDAVIVNPTGIIGPHDYGPSLMGRVLLGLMRGRVPALVGGGFNWVDVRDVCRGAMAAAKAGRRGERYILSGHYVTMREIANHVATLTGVRAPRLIIPLGIAHAILPFAWALQTARRRPVALTWASLHALAHHQRVDGSKAERELGYHPRPIMETIQDTVRWFEAAQVVYRN